MTAATDIVGTWYPSGYYGHFRSKTRNDILQEYRHEASPSPPSKFIKRVRKSPDVHCFSKHDNRHSFPTDASYFDTGLGRRKANRSFTAFNPEFMAWMPHKQEIEREGSHVSLYRLDFREGGQKRTDSLPQRVSSRIRRKMAEMDANDARLKWISDYKRQFSHGQPDTRINTDYNTGREFDGGGNNPRSHVHINTTGRLRKVVPPYLEHTRRRTKSAPPIRYSVGDCLVWNNVPSAPPTFRYALNAGSNTARQMLLKGDSRQVATSMGQKTNPLNGMTPAATTVSSFAPVQPPNSQMLASGVTNPPATATSVPVVVVD